MLKETKHQLVGALVSRACVQSWDQQGHSLDSGSDEHLCSPKFADLIPTDPDRSFLKLKDVQQNDLSFSGQKTVPFLVGPSGGKHAMEATATFRVAEVRDNILSLGKVVRKGFHFTLGPCGCSMEREGGACRSTWNETACVLKLMCYNVLRDLDTWRLDQLLRMITSKM